MMSFSSNTPKYFRPVKFLRSSLLAYNVGRSFSSQTNATNEQYCRDKVKQQDYEGYLIGLLFPRQYQSAYFALKAFNIEIATVRDQIPKNTNNIARLRFQFWRDV